MGTVTINVKDGGIGLVGGANPNAVVVLGVASKTNANVLQTFSQITDIVSAVGYGPGAEACAYQISSAGGSVYFMPVEKTVAATITAGTPIEGAVTSTGELSISGGTLPYDNYKMVITVVSATVDALVASGNIGVQVSLDGGINWGRTVLVPASGLLTLDVAHGAVKGDTGMIFLFDGGKFNVGDSFPYTCVAPFYSSTQLGTAFDALLADPHLWGLVHVVGYGTTAAATAALSSTISTKMNNAFLANRYARAELSCPDVTGDTDSNIISQWAAIDDTRQAVAATTDMITSPILGAVMERGHGFAMIARLSSIPASRSPGIPDDGPLIGVVSTNRDERVTPGLYDAGFDVARTIVGRSGVYASLGRIHVHSGSDFSIWPYARTMDLVCNGALQGATHFQNTSVKVTSTGLIDEVDAASIEKYIKGKIMALAAADISSVTVAVNRSANILATQTLIVTITVVPFGYAASVAVTIAYVNPALQLAA
jgi:hypothetical protein